MADSRIDENGLPVYAPGDYDFVRVVDRSTGASRNAIAPEVTAAARAISLALGELVADAREDIDAIIRDLGYLAPVTYASGLSVNDIKFTVSYNGDVYAPKPELVPFTTGAWNPAQWNVIQGDINLRSDLSDPAGGAVLVARSVVAVGSIAELRSHPSSARRTDLRYLVKEYSAGTGQGGGEFYWDPSSTDADDGGVTIAPPGVSVGRWKRVLPVPHEVSIAMFGATTDKSVDSYAAINAAMNCPGVGIVRFPPTDVRHEDDVIPARGYMSSQPITVPLDKVVVMDSPLIYSGTTYPALTVGVAPSDFNLKPHFKDFKLWVVKSSPSTWNDANELGLRINSSDFCNYNIHQVFGFRTAVNLNADDSSIAYCRFLWGELRGCKVGIDITVKNGGYFNECYHEAGRISSNPVPVGKESENRYGVITSTDGEPIENHVWVKPCFEIGSSVSNTESIPLWLTDCKHWRVIGARTEQHKNWVVRFDGSSEDNIIESTYGRVHPSVPTAFSGRDPRIAEDLTTRKQNKATTVRFMPYLEATSRVAVPLHTYPSGTGGGVRGMFFVPSADTVGARTRARHLANLRRAESGGVQTPAGASFLAARFRVDCDRLLITCKSTFTGELRVRCFSASGADLYDAGVLLVRNVLYGLAGAAAQAAYGGSYLIGPAIHGYHALSIDPSVRFIELLVGNNGATVESLEASAPEGSVSWIPVYDSVAAAAKPAWTENLDTGMVVDNAAYAGTGAHSWVLTSAGWVDRGSGP